MSFESSPRFIRDAVPLRPSVSNEASMNLVKVEPFTLMQVTPRKGDLIEGREVRLSPESGVINTTSQQRFRIKRLTFASIRAQSRGELSLNDRDFLSQNNITAEDIQTAYDHYGNLQQTAEGLGITTAERLGRIMDVFGIDHSPAHGYEAKRIRSRQLQDNP